MKSVLLKTVDASDEKSHTEIGSIRLIWLSRLAKFKTAGMSSCSTVS